MKTPIIIDYLFAWTIFGMGVVALALLVASAALRCRKCGKFHDSEECE